MGTLDGKIAFITGAAMGNGEGIARVMADKGATVALADINERVFQVAREIGRGALAYLVDITDFEQVQQAAEDVLSKLGRVDILVNNAGIARRIRLPEMNDDLFNLHYQVNVIGTWNCTKAFLPQMMANNYGRIVNMSSVTGPRVVDPGMMGYAMSKGAVLAFTKATAMEGVAHGVTANAILPGYILTPMVEHSAHETNPANPQAVIDGIAATVPMGRLGETKEIGYLAAFLASDEAAYITGGEFLIDGGAALPETNVMGKSND